MTQHFFNRPPRIQPELPQGELDIPSPPETGIVSGRLGLLTIVLPLLTIVAYALVVGRGGNPLFILPMGISVVATSLVAYLTWRRNSVTEQGKQQRYQDILNNLAALLQEKQEQQIKFYRHNYPDVPTLLRMAQHTDTRLWERRSEDDDFGVVRLGSGRLPSLFTLRAPSQTTTDSPLLPAALQLAEKSHYLTQVAIGLPLSKVATVGVIGKVPQISADFLRAVVAHLVVLHAPHELRLFIVGTPAAAVRWRWARWLPHVNTSRQNRGIGEQLCFEQGQLPAFWKNVQVELERRQTRQETDENANVRLPLLVIVVDSYDTLALDEVVNEAALAILLRQGQTLGSAVLFHVARLQDVPSECRAVIHIDSDSNNQQAYFRYEETGLNGIRRDGIADQLQAENAENLLARPLAPLEVRTMLGTDLPATLNIMELANVTTIDEFNILATWRQNRQPSAHPHPHVKLGMMAGNEPFQLTFEQNFGTGTHGMIAGTTGTGKSQLLMALIINLAIQYDPLVVNFVLVDYKGGTAFEALRELPHTVDVITNLHGQAGMRAFIAIRAELNRRTTVLTEARVQDIGQYYQRGFHLQRPLSFLFIIIDEFAEMLKDRPEFKAQLDSIARLGRAVGVHLILATQRPSGIVSEQIRANMKFRISLRVETADDSREMLGRTDATFLPANVPGRAYVQIGNQDLKLIQVAQTGNLYQGPQVDTTPPVIWLKRQSTNAASANREISYTETLLEVLTRYLRRLVVDSDEWQLPTKPWPDPLPEMLMLSQLQHEITDWLDEPNTNWMPLNWQQQALRATIGLVDNPAQAHQTRLELDLTRGHAVIFGVSGWGKTTLLRTILTSLLATHSPSDLHVYALDFAGRGLDVFQKAPHFAALILSFESERVERMFRRLISLVEERRTLLSQSQASTLTDYNAHHPDHTQPAIILVIDNFAEFRETYPDLLDSLTGLARDGRVYGIYILITAEQLTSVPPKIYSLFTERMALRLADHTEYNGMVGRIADAPDLPGRGFIRVDREPLEFQTALPIGPQLGIYDDELVETYSDSFEIRLLTHLMTKMQQSWQGSRPEPVDILQPYIALKPLLTGLPSLRVALGVRDLDLRSEIIDLKTRGPHFTLVGTPLSGKTTTLRTWLLALAYNNPPTDIQFVLIDFQQRLFQYGGNHRLGELPHVRTIVTEVGQLESVHDDLAAYFEAQRIGSSGADVYVMIDNYDDFYGSVGLSSPLYAKFAKLASQYSTYGLHFITSGLIKSVQTNDALMRVLTASRYGLALDVRDGLIALGGTIRSGSIQPELTPGRGYIIKSGQKMLIQVATPQQEQQTMEDSLDEWIKTISARHPAP